MQSIADYCTGVPNVLDLTYQMTWGNVYSVWISATF